MRETLRAGVQVIAAPQLFPTPASLAARMVELADIKPGARVLEPSAGTGRLLGAMGGRMFGHNPERGAAVAVEINQALADRLRSEFPLTRVHCADFLQWGAGEQFDAIVMNPPFINGADILHIKHAAGMLKPGGRLMLVTCSLLPDEGEAQLAAALARHPGLSVLRPTLPGLSPDWITPDGGLRLRPYYWADKGGMDGFFMACLRRP
jgi:protein-L-isoaspartate O-methyltransferase